MLHFRCRLRTNCLCASVAATISLALGALAEIRPEVDAAIERYGADRIGIVIGTSTSGIAESESALRQYAITGVCRNNFTGQQELASPAAMLAAASLASAGQPMFIRAPAHRAQKRLRVQLV